MRTINHATMVSVYVIMYVCVCKCMYMCVAAPIDMAWVDAGSIVVILQEERLPGLHITRAWLVLRDWLWFY